MILREANQTDAGSIARVQVDTWHTTYTGLVPQEMLDKMSVDQRAGIWSDIISRGKTKTFVLELDSNVVGFLNVGPARDEDKDCNQTGELLAIYISQAHQGAGFGKDLFAKAVDYFKENGYTDFSLWVLDSNIRARQFYERMGMSADGKTKLDEWGAYTLSEVRYIANLSHVEKHIGR